MAAIVAVLALSLASAPIAEAHEIAVAIVISVNPDGSEVDAADVIDGLRFAIDRSPDVGHPPGPDAGDHLGGVDLELIDLGNVGNEVVGSSVLAAIADGATLVVVVGDAESISAVADVVPPASAFTIAVLTEGRDSDSSLPATVLRRSSTVSADAAATLSEAFETEYGEELSESAGIGYDVGQLLDVLIAETDGALPDAAALASVSARVQARLTFTTIGGVDEQTPTGTELPADISTNSNRSKISTAVPVGLGAALAGMLIVRFRRRKSGRAV